MCDTVLGSKGPIAPSFLEGLACHARRLPPGVPLCFAACLDRCRRAARRHDASNSSLPDHPSLSLVSPTPGACSLRPLLHPSSTQLLCRPARSKTKGQAHKKNGAPPSPMCRRNA